MYWNKVWQEILEAIKNNILSWKLESWFFLVSWPKNIWKKTKILELINQLWVLPQDLLIIEDPGKIDGKFYQIKIDVPEKEQILVLQDKKFLNLWVRQIQDFVSTTPFWKYKVVFIENIERLNISSANAFLKTLEEPGKNVYIFATASNKEKLLPTIISRATLINFYPLTYSEFEEFLSNYELDSSKKKLIYAVSWGRVGLAKHLIENWMEFLQLLEEFLQLEELKSSTWWRFSIIKQLIQQEKLDNFIDALIFYYSHSENFEKVQKLIDIKQKSQANVNLENLMFSYLMTE